MNSLFQIGKTVKFVPSRLPVISVFHRLASTKRPKSTRTSVPKMESRPGLKTTKIDNEVFHSLFTPELNVLADLFKKHKYDLRMAGGAVRDLMMGIAPADIDFASDATPTQMKELFEAEGIRMLHKKGEEHGTITCRINDSENFEVTTLRIDVVCDGRRAEVNFTTDWELDAFRRDLTINSLFCGLDGTVYDYTGGIDDIKTRTVRFVGDAVSRIQEDYLRILRYFRFYGRIAISPNEHNAETIKAIIDNKEGMASLSGERIWTELKRIVNGRFAPDVMTTMLDECKLHEYVGLNPKSSDLKEFRRVFEKAADENGKADLQPCTVLSALFSDEKDVMEFHKKCKISNEEKFLSLFIVETREEASKNKDNLKYFQDLIMDEIYLKGSNDFKSRRNRVIELLKYIDNYELINSILEWEQPKLPINGFDLKDSGVSGKNMKNVLRYLYVLWRNSDYTMSFEDLSKHVHDPIAIQEDKTSPPLKKQKIS